MEKTIAKKSLEKIVRQIKNNESPNVSKAEVPQLSKALKTLDKIANLGQKSRTELLSSAPNATKHKLTNETVVEKAVINGGMKEYLQRKHHYKHAVIDSET